MEEVRERQEESLRHREQLLREMEIANQLTRRDQEKAEAEKEELKLELLEQVKPKLLIMINFYVKRIFLRLENVFHCTYLIKTYETRMTVFFLNIFLGCSVGTVFLLRTVAY